MSTPSALASEVRPYWGRVIRIVEAQHQISTNRLAASAADQTLLEALADQVKPQVPESARHLPWLLASPFRYGLGRPSRFRAADVLPGIFYAPYGCRRKKKRVKPDAGERCKGHQFGRCR